MVLIEFVVLFHVFIRLLFRRAALPVARLRGHALIWTSCIALNFRQKVRLGNLPLRLVGARRLFFGYVVPERRQFSLGLVRRQVWMWILVNSLRVGGMARVIAAYQK